MDLVDYIIVGSGASGSISAETICGLGYRVLMIDTGFDNDYKPLDNNDFISKRIYDDSQSDYFLGKKYEVLSENLNPNIPQQTPQRAYVNSFVDKLLPFKTNNFFPVESLALGGLGNSWGLGSYAFSEKEIKKCGLNYAEMKDAYKWVADIVGVSGEKNDDASKFCHNGTFEMQNSIELNKSAKSLLKEYEKKRRSFNKQNIFMGRPSLALLTQDKLNRKAYSYKDTDFYEDEGNSAFRTRLKIKELIDKGKLEYKSGWLVVSFLETQEGVELNCRNTKTNEAIIFRAKRVLLASSTLSTSRIVMRSFNSNHQLPILCNAYTYMPMIYWPFLGKKHTNSLSGLAQLAMFYDLNNDDSNIAMASIYNYRSLLNFRILKQMPLNHAAGTKFLQLIIPSLFIAGIFHPASYKKGNYIKLTPDKNNIIGDVLETNYEYLGEELKDIQNTEKTYSKAFSRLNCTILKKLRTPIGGSIHYAGSLPFSNTEELFRIAPNGKLYGTKNIYIADASGFSYLPGKGLTLSLMANAHLVAKNILTNE
jgi:hypothetical protein